ncbi:MAG TPA: tail fiber domain-containing protein [Rhizomicrobium sp.]|nr:tail fiber domain-containing protein [Rhizomicrobium sp.]
MEGLRGNLIAILVSSIIAAAIFFLSRQSEVNTDDARYGAQAGSMVIASRAFAQQGRSTIITAVNAAGGAAVRYTAANIAAAGALDPSVTGATPTGGTYCLEFRTYNGGANIQGALVVINETIPKNSVDAAIVAKQAATTFTGQVDASGNVAYQGGSQPLSAFTGPNACPVAANAFAALITDNDTIGTTNYLCRTALPGNPSCNTMAQDINMGGNNLANANTISGSNLVVSGFDPSGFGQVRMNTGNYGAFFRNDGTTFYLLSTASGNPNGQWNGLRPFFYNLTSGAVNIDGTGAGTSFGGSITAPAYYHSSDARLKHDIKAIRDPWSVLAPISGSHWTWNETGQPDDGVIAQQVMMTAPELVHVDENGKLAVNYDGLVGFLIPAVKDLRHTIKIQSAEIARLKIHAAVKTDAAE